MCCRQASLPHPHVAKERHGAAARPLAGLQLQLYTQDAAGSRDTSLKRQARNGSTSARALPESKAYYCRYTARTEVCRSPGAVSSVHAEEAKKGTASLPEAMSRPIPWATLLGHRPSRRPSPLVTRTQYRHGRPRAAGHARALARREAGAAGPCVACPARSP